MNSKSVQYFQQEQLSNNKNNILIPTNQTIPTIQSIQSIQSIPSIPSIDMNFILLNRCIKYILNFLSIYMFVTLSIYNFPNTNVHIFIILICTISSIVFYILDMLFPSCYI